MQRIGKIAEKTDFNSFFFYFSFKSMDLDKTGSFSSWDPVSQAQPLSLEWFMQYFNGPLGSSGTKECPEMPKNILEDLKRCFFCAWGTETTVLHKLISNYNELGERDTARTLMPNKIISSIF